MDRSTKFAWVVVIASIALLVALALREPISADPLSVLFWIGLLAAVELLPMYMGLDIELTLGFVIILPVVILFPPPVAMAIVGLGSFDPRELRRDVPIHKALFNRSQSMLAAAAATLPFAVWSTPRFSFTGIASAALLHLVVNLGLVALAVRIERGTPLKSLALELLPRPITGFVISYALLTGLGAATALAYTLEQGGGWAVAAILIPLLFARMSILGARNQQELSERLRKQHLLLLRSTESLFEAREMERKRIAATIHDSSLQFLAGASYACGNAADALRRNEADAARDLMDTAHRAVDAATESIRASVVDLRRSSIDHGGLRDTIRKFSDEMSTLWGSQVTIEGDLVHEPPLPVSLAAFQIFQESLVNSLKHSGSSSVLVNLSETDGMVHLVVEDDGKGFDPTDSFGDNHVGLELMRERVNTVGGRLELKSAPGEGTRLEVVLPAGAEV